MSWIAIVILVSVFCCTFVIGFGLYLDHRTSLRLYRDAVEAVIDYYEDKEIPDEFAGPLTDAWAYMHHAQLPGEYPPPRIRPMTGWDDDD